MVQHLYFHAQNTDYVTISYQI